MTEMIRKKILQLMLALLSIAALVVVMDRVWLNLPANAQEPDEQAPSPLDGFSPETLAAFGLSPDDIQAAAIQFDLAVRKTTSHSAVSSGQMVTFTIAITNNGPDTALGALFQDKVPAEMKNVSFSFNTDAVSNGATDPADKIWLLAPIAAGNSAIVTVTGELTSANNVTVTNEALVSAYDPATENIDSNNNSTASVAVAGYNPGSPALGPIYLPAVFKAPPSLILVQDDFTTKTYNWPDSSDDIINDCKFGYKTSEGEYFIKAYDGQACWIPATHSDFKRTAGYFEIEVRRRSGDEDKFAYGLYINGKDGDENYYLYWIRPKDSCGWRFVKRYDDNDDHEKSGGCSSSINQGSGTNRLAIAHASDGTISIYVNDHLLYSYADGSNGGSAPLTGTGTGLYVDADSNDIEIGFSTFTIYNK